MERIISLAREIRREYGGRDIFATAENSGAVVWLRELGGLKGFYICENGRRYIVVNRALKPLLRRTVCAHELGHDLLHRELSAGGIRENTLFLSTNKTEREANLFATEMLLTDRETLSVLEYARDIDSAADELGVLPEILGYKLELLNHKGYHFNTQDISSDFLK
ncbi:MAG: ImmA/IrrE family metallo-endopeptidase [Oscillospiraceae bacterium]